MTERFAERKTDLMGIERPAKHDRHNVHRAAIALLAGGADFIKPCLVMVEQLLDARMQANKGLTVRGKHKALFATPIKSFD